MEGKISSPLSTPLNVKQEAGQAFLPSGPASGPALLCCPGKVQGQLPPSTSAGEGHGQIFFSHDPRASFLSAVGGKGFG